MQIKQLIAYFFFAVLLSIPASTFAQEEKPLSKLPVFKRIETAMVTPDEVYRLDLSERGLQELDPQIGELKNLRELRLDGNQLRSLPKRSGN